MKYYSLIGKPEKNAPFEIIFGDYDRQAVQDEKAETTGFYSLRIMTSNESQQAIDSRLTMINSLNRAALRN